MIRYQSLLIFTLVLMVTANLWAKPIVICDSCEVKSISEGIKIAMEFDTLLVKKGTYKEYNILIDKPLTLIGEDYPIIDGEEKGEIIRIVSDGVTLDGFFIINVGTSYTTDHAAIRVVKSENFLIQNVVLEKLFFGIYLEKSSNGKVYHNKIIGDAKDEYNSGNGIQLWYSHHVEVSNNIVQGARDGIYLEFSDNIAIHNNKSTGNLRYGLHFMFSDDDIYTDNIFENNGAGVAVMFSKNIVMKGNTFRKNWGTAAFGMLLKEINDAEISNNTFEENTIGINIEGSNRIDYKGNNFIKNGWGIKVLGACYTNTFSGNNFLYNSFDISYDSNLNDNVFDGNYWSDYTGYDLDKNGIGDVPYRPVKLFSYIVNKTPESIVLLRSLFMDIIDFSEKVSPVFTPDNLLDINPLMTKVQ
ncbi:nitrous oxide reductase family maturation protein NosD [Maribacter sp. BPC-D8]|uniref:nitrous oxide reductase family maturation protein NosD n=1 Tax=Maribacter sp. BPC-D8 TaxID=3053613 RepID=UPI002B496643|nr:nitrous oxide reductase family maturation protein NosD [Maribacter sp. BPC-D8]WRI30111.1 nitrous oxide reductase family maturation protein NosD [Maribacter sp. BPC-D8]